MQSRNVLFFSPGQSERGGLARHSFLITKGLTDCGWSVVVVARAHTARRLLIRRGKALVVEVPGFSRRLLGATLFSIVGMIVAIMTRKPRVILSMQLSSPSLIAALASAILRTPFVVMSTSSGLVSEIQFVQESRFVRLRRYALSRSSAAIAQTDSQRAELQEAIPNLDISVIPTPVEPSIPAPLSGRRTACYAGRLSEEKGLFTLLDAWRLVVGALGDARLVIVGNGGEFRSVEGRIVQKIVADPALSASVSTQQWQRDVRGAINECDIFVFPSQSEGMSNVLLEACALERVVVASDISSNRSVLGDDYPLLFRVGDHHALANTLCRAFDDRRIREAARRAIRDRTQRFFLDIVIRELERVLLDVSDRARR